MTNIVKACKKLYHLSLRGFDCSVLMCLVEPNNIKQLTLQDIFRLTNNGLIGLIELNPQFERISTYETELLIKDELDSFITERRDIQQEQDIKCVEIEWLTPHEEDPDGYMD
jgi:hypothetical protein